jgi:hypothetical protein
VEVMTRVAVVPLPVGHGLLREAITRLYSVFATTSDILRRHGPTVAEPRPDGQYSFGYLAVVIFNGVIRPFLAQWHPLLEQWEATRPPDRSRAEHEQAWRHAVQLRAGLDTIRASRTQYALSGAMPKPGTGQMDKP